jgi:peptide/nickel transport system substrate-binding protein
MDHCNEVPKRHISRREFLRLSVSALAGAAVAQHAAFSNVAAVDAATPPPAPAAPRTTYQEAPMLSALVAKGWLPPVDQRLPATPCVITPLEGVHEYGGVINRAYKGTSDRWGPTKMRDHSFVWYDQSLVLTPRLISSWEVDADASDWTFHLRPGTRWSNGAALTTADIAWWYTYVLKDPRITTGLTLWMSNGQTMDLEVVDSVTFKLKFTAPNPLFLYKLARDGTSPGATFILCPSEYMKRYHIDFTANPTALQAEAAAAGFGSWADYFKGNRNLVDSNPARPDLGPWVAKNAVGQNLFVMERNPYYYCVDPDNRQLPYVDQVIHKLYSLDSDFVNWLISGAIDFQARGVSFSYYETLKIHESAGGYRVLPGVSATHIAIALNHTTKTSRLRTFFQTRKVRIALSLAVNRAAINTVVFNNLATPRQYSPASISPQYYPALSNAYITYDVTQANTLLDEAGYALKDEQGYRLWNDGSGQRISFTIEGISQAGSSDEAVAQMVVSFYAAVGIKAIYQYVDRNTYMQHVNANEIEAGWFGGDRTIIPFASDAPIFRGLQIDRPWAAAWTLWWNNPSDPNAETPPVDHWIRTIWNLWNQIAVEPSSTQRDVLFKQILDIWATELPMIGYLGEIPALAVVKNDLHNFTAGFAMDDTTADEEVRNPETNSWSSALVPSLTINYPNGQPGSFFTLIGTNYPPNSTALITINGHAIETLFTDGTGRLEFVFDTSLAGVGIYEVTVKVNPEASTSFQLLTQAPLRAKESTAASIAVPAHIASNPIFIPGVRR